MCRVVSGLGVTIDDLEDYNFLGCWVVFKTCPDQCDDTTGKPNARFDSVYPP
jgi:hypothetical protein